MTVWHRTGDTGRLDDSGRLWLPGRTGAVVEGGRGAICPFAVELAAESRPGVARAALAGAGGQPVLVIEGAADCTARARALGLQRVVKAAAIPLDRRHRSKVDYTALQRLLPQG